MERHLRQLGFSIHETKCFTILHNTNTILRQIRVAESKLSLMSHSEMRAGMQKYLEDLKFETPHPVLSISLLPSSSSLSPLPVTSLGSV
jgi:hypothetical protein